MVSNFLELKNERNPPGPILIITQQFINRTVMKFLKFDFLIRDHCYFCARFRSL